MTHYQTLVAAIEAGDEASARAILDDANRDYYGSGSSQLTDAEYDLAHRLFEAKFGTKLRTGSRTDRQAGTKQDWPLLANWLGKSADTAELQDWMRGRNSRIPALGRDTTGYASPKWDGLSIVVTYDGSTGAVVRALTRGEDGFGVDVTRLFAGETHFREGFAAYFPEHAGPVATFGVKYELVMSWTDVERMSQETGKAYKNPRNSVAGIVSADNSRERRDYVVLVPLDFEFSGMEEAGCTRNCRLSIMEAWFAEEINGAGEVVHQPFFTGNGQKETPFHWFELALNDYQAALEIYDHILSWRGQPHFDFMIDGVVFEYADADMVEALGGRTSDCPDYATAAKFPSMVGRSKAVSLDWDLGPTGRLTPVLNYEPVDLDGRTFSRTSLSNVTRFDALKLAPGTPIVIEIRGDVLAWVDRDGPDPEGAVPFAEHPGARYTTRTLKDGSVVRVFAFADAPLDGSCERMMVKCGIKGVRIETITKLVEGGLVRSLSDMWRLDEAAVASLPGLGLSSAETVCSAIAKKLSAHLWDWEILASVSINGVGRTLAKEALKHATLQELLALVEEPDGGAAGAQIASSIHAAIGPERTRMLLEGAASRADDIRGLMGVDPGFLATKSATSSYDGPKYKVVVTGDLKRFPDRDVFKTIIELMGHKLVGSISGKTDFLITNTPSSGTVKNREAQAKGVRIVTEEEAIQLLGIDLSKVNSTVPGASGSPVATGPTLGTMDELM